MAEETSNGVKTDTNLSVLNWLILVIFVVFWGAVLVLNLNFALGTFGYIALWVFGIAIMTLLLAFAGREINGQWFGILIDSRNKISLSRLQITLWTIMVLSAYFSMAIPRVLATLGENPTLTQDQSLDITFPPELILAMGISATSFAGSNLIKGSKKSRKIKIDAKLTPDTADEHLNTVKSEIEGIEKRVKILGEEGNQLKSAWEAAKQASEAAPDDATKQTLTNKAEELYNAKMKDQEKEVKNLAAKKDEKLEAEKKLKDITEAQGLLHKNTSPSEAGWADLFRGEEIGNYTIVDMSKVQMLFFTIVVVVAYAAAITGQLINTQQLLSATGIGFPPFSQSLNALLGISHGTYLSVKTVDSN